MREDGIKMAMPTPTPIPRPVIDEASRWFANRDSGLPIDEGAFEAWLQADPMHRRAFREVEALWSDLGSVAVPTPACPRLRRARRRPRLRMLKRTRGWIPAAAAACLALLVIGKVDDWSVRLIADAATGVGERRTLRLSDGSRIELNTDSAVAYEFSAGRRVVRLLKGEASFMVAPDRDRPFTVQSGDGATTALGTRFIVRRQADATRVTVAEHRVRVDYDGGDQPSDISLGEGEAVTYGPAGMGARIAVNSADAEAWTQGLLVFENRPLGEVIGELARYSPGYIGVLGKETRDRRVSGVFNIDDPLGAIDKLQHSLGLRSARITDRAIVIFDRS
jgi:transmembrane sensor